jgi:copper chaperone
MLICIGHSPVKPLAASPLMGSTAQSNRRSNVRRNFMAGIIAKLFYSCFRNLSQEVRAALSCSKERLTALDLPAVGKSVPGMRVLVAEITMKFEVKDMSCGGCANSITRAVTSVGPDAILDIDVATRIVKIDSDLSLERLSSVIEAAGFHPVVSA